MSNEFLVLLEQFEKEKGISSDVLIEALEAALVSAYKRNYGANLNVRVEIDRKDGNMKVFTQKTVVEAVEHPETQISLEDAKAVNQSYEIGDICEQSAAPQTFGRIAAQTARQVMTQRIREAERNMVYDEFSGKENDIITGTVQRVERGNVMVDIGTTEGVLYPKEQVAADNYTHGQKIKVYVVGVKRTTKGPQIIISRTHPGLIRRLFELEVPEIQSGIVEIKSISREAGSRTKIAVYAKDENVDPIGACVGPKGGRVQNIVDELKGEKIDIIKYSDNPEEYISASLSPAKVLKATANADEGVCSVVVDDSQLSLAIGKEGQNARLAAKLTGWKIDIEKSDGTEYEA